MFFYSTLYSIVGIVFSVTTFGVQQAQADCIEVVKPLLQGQCRARPDTKTYIGTRTAEGLWTYSCDYECATGYSSFEVAKAIHQDYETNQMNSLVCKGVELDMLESSGSSIAKQCRRTVTGFEIFSQSPSGLGSLIRNDQPFSKDMSVRQRIVSAFANEMREIAAAYIGAAEGGEAADQKRMLSNVGDDLLAMAAVFETRGELASNASARQVLDRYLPYLRGEEISATPGTREGFVVIHLNMHRDLILNLAKSQSYLN